MGRRYEELFGELEEQFPLPGERVLTLPQALEALARQVEPVSAESAPVEESLLGRVLAREVSLGGLGEEPPAELPAGTRLEAFHLHLLARAGLREVPVRRPLRVAVLAAATPSGSGADPALLHLLCELTNWRAEVKRLAPAGAAEDDLLKAVAEGVTADLLCVLSREATLPAVREAARAVGALTLFEAVRCRPGGEAAAMRRQECLLLLLPAESASAFVAHRLFLEFALGRLSGVPPTPSIQLPTDRDLPMSGEEALLLPARLVRGRAGLTVSPLGEPGHPTIGDLIEASCLIYLPPHCLPREPGDLVHVLHLGRPPAGFSLEPTSQERTP